jgi:hypothetical protein
MGFTPSKAEPDIWMRQNGNIYEYIGVYVDDLAVVTRNPQAIIDVQVKGYRSHLVLSQNGFLP